MIGEIIFYIKCILCVTILPILIAYLILILFKINTSKLSPSLAGLTSKMYYTNYKIHFRAACFVSLYLISCHFLFSTLAGISSCYYVPGSLLWLPPVFPYVLIKRKYITGDAYRNFAGLYIISKSYSIALFVFWYSLVDFGTTAILFWDTWCFEGTHLGSFVGLVLFIYSQL